MQDEVVFKTWSSKVSCESRTTPRSLTEDARARSFLSIDILKSGSLAPVAQLVEHRAVTREVVSSTQGL